MAIMTFNTVGQELFSLCPQHSLMVTVSSTAIILVSSLVIIAMWHYCYFYFTTIGAMTTVINTIIALFVLYCTTYRWVVGKKGMG